MRNWGIVITGFYALVIVFLLSPMFWLLVGEEPELLPLEWEASWAWMLIAIAVAGQGLLLFLSVDTSRKYLKPRTHLGASIPTEPTDGTAVGSVGLAAFP